MMRILPLLLWLSVCPGSARMAAAQSPPRGEKPMRSAHRTPMEAPLPPQHTTAAAPIGGSRVTQIRENLNRILSDAEFQPEGRDEGVLQSALQKLGEQWEAFERWFGRLLNRVFGSVGLAGGNELVVWTFIALFLILMAFVLARALRHYFRGGRPDGGRRARAQTFTDAEEIETVTDPTSWLAQAQRYADADDFRRAFRAVFIALLLQMDRAGVVSYDRARTNGDYLRLLRERGLNALAEALRPLTREFDLRWYGHHATGEDDYRRCRSEYDRLHALLTAAPTPSPEGRTPATTGRA